jgi:hypothetical protein
VPEKTESDQRGQQERPCAPQNELQPVEMESDSSDRDSVAWLAAATGDDPADVAAGLETGARRLAENEVRSRRANEERVRAQTGDSLPVWLEILCECADRNCRQPLTIAAAEYAWLRERRSRFAVLPGHEAPAVEDVVERFPGYVIVEKHVETRLDLEGVDPK